MAHGKAQDALVKLIAQAPQHALAQYALVDVDAHAEAAVDQQQAEQGAAKDQEIGNLIEREGHDLLREVLAVDGVVDDDLGQAQGHVQEWEGRHRRHEDRNLLGFGVPPDIREDSLFHVFSLRYWALRHAVRTRPPAAMKAAAPTAPTVLWHGNGGKGAQKPAVSQCEIVANRRPERPLFSGSCLLYPGRQTLAQGHRHFRS